MMAGLSRDFANDSTNLLSESLYSRWDGNGFRRLVHTEKPIPPSALTAYQALRDHIRDESFSCLGAKAALNGEYFRIGYYSEMNSASTTQVLAGDLTSFVKEQAAAGSNYTSFAAIFAAPQIEDELSWEKLLWKQLNILHAMDAPTFDWDPTVSGDPADPTFSFSFASTGFFIVGLNPQSSRLARRFPWATMVFNPHAQFERLREAKQFDRLQQTIRAREMALQGTLNPNLSSFGELSEARQYSGRPVDEKWKCPFHSLRAKLALK